MGDKERGRLLVMLMDGQCSVPFIIKKNKLLIGRGDSCEIRINVDEVSPEHCVISFNDEGRGFVAPVTKSCLTLLNGELIKRQVSLEHNDVITIVKRRFQFLYPSSSKFNMENDAFLSSWSKVKLSCLQNDGIEVARGRQIFTEPCHYGRQPYVPDIFRTGCKPHLVSYAKRHLPEKSDPKQASVKKDSAAFKSQNIHSAAGINHPFFAKTYSDLTNDASEHIEHNRKSKIGGLPQENCAVSFWSKTKNSFMPNDGIEEKKVASCSTQTDVPDSLIDTENHEDKDLSSLDAKDVTLLTEGMKELLIKGSDHDVKIVVKDKEFRAHRNILRTRSPVLAMMLTHDSKESSTGTISIEDCDPDSFDEFLLYVYSGRTENLTPSKALQLYYTADKYDLPVLKKRCAILLKTSLSVASICDVILLAAKHGETELLDAATEFFAQNMREILETVRWQEFLSENPVEGNELYIKSMDILVPRK